MIRPFSTSSLKDFCERCNFFLSSVETLIGKIYSLINFTSADSPVPMSSPTIEKAGSSYSAPVLAEQIKVESIVFGQGLIIFLKLIELF